MESITIPAMNMLLRISVHFSLSLKVEVSWKILLFKIKTLSIALLALRVFFF